MKKADECQVILSAVEKRDEGNIEAVAQQYVKEIQAIAEKVNAPAGIRTRVFAFHLTYFRNREGKMIGRTTLPEQLFTLCPR